MGGSTPTTGSIPNHRDYFINTDKKTGNNEGIVDEFLMAEIDST